MPEPVIRHRPTSQPSAARSAQADSEALLTRASRDPESLTSEEATQLLTAMRNNPLADGQLLRELEARVSRDVHANAPSASHAPTRSRAASRVARGVADAYSASRSSSVPNQAFLDNLQSAFGGARGLAREMTRMSPAEFKQALVASGVSPRDADSAREFVETAIAHQFERDVQRHVVSQFEGLAAELDQSARGSGPQFEARLEQLVGTGGQRLLRVMRGMGIDTSELSGLLREWGGPNVDRDAVVQQMRGPLREALQEMRDVAHSELDSARSAHFLDEPYTQYTGAAQAVAREWGLPRGVLDRPPTSVVASGLARRKQEATGEDVMATRARETAGGRAGTFEPISGALYSLATLALDFGRGTGDARREATMAEVGEGDPGEAIEGRARATADLIQGVGTLGFDHVIGGAADQVAEHATEGANVLIDVATGTSRQPTGTTSVLRDGVEAAVGYGVDVVFGAERDAAVRDLSRQDTPVPHKDIEAVR